MLINTTLTKKQLEKLIQTTFYYFGEKKSALMLDSLKLLGFNYATNAGLSISIEDLRTPKDKKSLIKKIQETVFRIDNLWEQGIISENERFENFINDWHDLAETLKNKIIEYYEKFDPVNNLYLMAFSGARGNMSQVRQLIGMRGLMADQDGNIIDLPIETNFREGLSSADYMISSYGARKGIVDTALKTADSGYLTRRLIYLCQELIIREIDCKSKQGILLFPKHNQFTKNIIGRTLISYSKNLFEKHIIDNRIITEQVLEELVLDKLLSITIRSPLTCYSAESVCQKCYGWNLAQSKEISLGEAVGILAAQSIGEPGTQLTMRTFHTGGIFTNEANDRIFAKFSGQLHIPDNLFRKNFRNTKGEFVSLIEKEMTFSLINSYGFKTEIKIPKNSLLYISNSQFVKKNQLLAEISEKKSVLTNKKLKPILAPYEGELIARKYLARRLSVSKQIIFEKIEKNSSLWLTLGKIFELPIEANIKFLNMLTSKRAFAETKFISPFEGFSELTKNSLLISSKNHKYKFKYPKSKLHYKNFYLVFVPLIKNNQYIDISTILAYIYIVPKITQKIYFLKQKKTQNNNLYFVITETDIWKFYSDNLNSVIFDEQNFLSKGTKLNSVLQTKTAGLLLKKNGASFIFQRAFPFFLHTDIFVNSNKNNFVYKNQILAKTIKYTQQTQDIVQGLPKIEELIEARALHSEKALLSSSSGIFLDLGFFNKYLNSNEFYNFNKNFLCIFTKTENKNKFNKHKKIDFNNSYQSQITIINSLLTQYKLVLFDKRIWKLTLIPKIYQPIRSNKKNTRFKFVTKTNDVFVTKNGLKIWEPVIISHGNQKFYELDSNFQFRKEIANTEFCNLGFISKKNQIESKILLTKSNNFILFEEFNPYKVNTLADEQKFIGEKSHYIDLIETITQGIIDFHELLKKITSYYSKIEGNLYAYKHAIRKFQLILLNSIQSIYASQDVELDSKHIEIVIRQMTAKALIKKSGDSPLLVGEFINISFITELYDILKVNTNYKVPYIEPIFLSATSLSRKKEGFLAAAGFQETKKVLIEAALEGITDWISGLKESVLVGRLGSGGSSFLAYKHNVETYFSKKQLN